MAGRGLAHRIKTHRIYTPWEAANALGKHRQTVIRWIKSGDLLADTTQKPWLIKGHDLKAYLGHRFAKARCKLAAHHLYCFRCKLPREPAGKFADYTQQTATNGMLTALCPDCDCIMHKVVGRSVLEAIRAKIDVTVQQANPRLVSREDAPSNVTFESRAETHVKKHVS